MEASDLGSRGRRLLRRALRAGRNRPLLSNPGRETREERRKTEGDLARGWKAAQRLRGIYRRIAKRKVGRSSELSALNGAHQHASKPASASADDSRCSGLQMSKQRLTLM